MAFLSGQSGSVTWAAAGWANAITKWSARHTYDEAAIRVMGNATTSRVLGASDWTVDLEFAVEDDLAAADLEVDGTAATLTLTIATGDTLVGTGMVMQCRTTAGVDGAVTGRATLESSDIASTLAFTGA